MVHVLPMTVPYRPGQRCVVFKDDPVSGATLGYHGTIVRLLTRSIRRYPDVPDLWYYRVFVPALNRKVDVAAQNLFVTGEIDQSATDERPPEDNVCEIRFDYPPREDNSEIHGVFRLPGRGWELFSFQKREQSEPTFELHMQVEGVESGRCEILYSVPATERLDRAYVLKSLAKILDTCEPE